MKWWHVFWLWHHNEQRHHHFSRRDAHLLALRKKGVSKADEQRMYARLKRVFGRLSI